MVDAIIFDMDGVLIQSELATFRLLQTLTKNHGLTLNDYTLPQRVGKKIKPFIEEVFGPEISDKTKEAIVNEFYQEYKTNLLSYITPIPTTVNFIKSYRAAFPLAIASVSSRQEIEKILVYLEIADKFKCIVSSDDIAHLKPDPEIYQMVAKKLRVKPKNCLVVEDSPIGVQSAKGAGMNVYVLLNGFNRKEQFTTSVSGFLKTTDDIVEAMRKGR